MLSIEVVTVCYLSIIANVACGIYDIIKTKPKSAAIHLVFVALLLKLLGF